MTAHQLVKMIKEKTFLLAFFDILFLTLPGVLALYTLDKTTFLSLDWARLSLLASSFVLPFAFANATALMSFWDEAGPPDKDSFFVVFSLGSIFAGLGFYLALGVQMAGLPYTPKFDFTVIIVEILVLLVICYEEYKFVNKRS